jgi:hypothetical protein
MGSEQYEPMELVHVDVFGPIDTPSLRGSKYAILFTDDYSKWRSIYFMKSKAQTLEKLKQYLDDVSGLLRGRKVQGLHSDNGGMSLSVEPLRDTARGVGYTAHIYWSKGSAAEWCSGAV